MMHTKEVKKIIRNILDKIENRLHPQINEAGIRIILKDIRKEL